MNLLHLGVSSNIAPIIVVAIVAVVIGASVTTVAALAVAFVPWKVIRLKVACWQKR